MSNNNNLKQAKKIRNDEFYTKIEDVEAELSHWKHRLKNKRIICPCDGPESAFVKYLESVKEDWQIKSITYSSYNPFTKEGKPFQELDYSNYDICITNPPFSLYHDVLKYIVGSKIDFILLAPTNIIYRVSAAKYFLDKRIYLGWNKVLHMKFSNTDKSVACCWLTNFSDFTAENIRPLTGKLEDLRPEELVFDKRIIFEDGSYPLYFDALKTVPVDYKGWLEVPVTVAFRIDWQKTEWFTDKFVEEYSKRPEKPFKGNYKEADLKRNCPTTGKNNFSRVYFKYKN